VTRKEFTRAAAMTMVNLSPAVRPSVASVVGANCRIGIGLIGAVTVGRKDMTRSLQIANPYEPHLQPAIGMTNGAAKRYKDFRGLRLQADRRRYHRHTRSLACMRSRRKTNSKIETMDRSTSAPIIGNIAYRLGRKLRWERDAGKFIGNSEANERLTQVASQPWRVAVTTNVAIIT
jgi:hypothetical protein